MSNEKAGCGRIPLVSESRLKIAALSSDPGNSFRGFWHCAEILTFSLLPSRAGGEESMCRDNKRAQLCLRLVGHTPGIVHLKFSKITNILISYDFCIWLVDIDNWGALITPVYPNLFLVCWRLFPTIVKFEKDECQIGLHFKQVPN